MLFFFFLPWFFLKWQGEGGDALCALLSSLHMRYQQQTPKNISLLTVDLFYPLLMTKLRVSNAILSYFTTFTHFRHF